MPTLPASLPVLTVMAVTPLAGARHDSPGGVVTLRIIAKTAPGEQYALSRELRERAKVALDKAGIRGPALPPYSAGAGI